MKRSWWMLIAVAGAAFVSFSMLAIREQRAGFDTFAKQGHPQASIYMTIPPTGRSASVVLHAQRALTSGLLPAAIIGPRHKSFRKP